MDELRILSPLGMLGYGFPEQSFEEGLKRKPHAIVADAGSTDAGPHKLGAGVGIVSRIAAKQDLQKMLLAGRSLGIPVLVGSAGGSGARKHVDWTLDIVREIIAEQRLDMRLGVIYTDIEKPWLKQKLGEGKVSALPGVPELTAAEVDETIRIVAQIGHEPYIEMLRAGVDVIIGGRTYDPVMTASVGIYHGFDAGLAYHMGKILECGAQCCIPGSAKDCMLGYLYRDSFVLEPMNPIRVCTPVSVAAHTMYEKSHTYRLPGPGGILDLEYCTFTAENDSMVRVAGSKFIQDDVYRLKLEGSKQVGYRAIFIAGIRDPLAIQSIDSFTAYAEAETKAYFKQFDPADYCVDYKIYGKNGVMGGLEPQQDITSNELCIIGDVVAKTQEMADTICAFIRSTMMHYHYEGRYATAGNLAFPFAPSDIPFGPVYRFSVYHLAEVDSPLEIVKTEIINYKGGQIS